MSAEIFRLRRDHQCHLPHPRNFGDGDLARCTECGKWWRREWDHVDVRSYWGRITRRRAKRLLKRQGVEPS